MKRKLGNLKAVDLRVQWKHEAHDFTNWLAEDENIELLSDELGIGIENVRTERRESGRFNVDIVAEESTSGKKIIIENQLEITDHKHLGQILTYASGHDAEIIIWIVNDYREEHKQAIDWFNNHMGNKINFFLIQVELWQIGKSPFAPKFNIISQPNEWANVVKTDSEVTELKLMQKEFWDKFKEYAIKHNTHLRLGRKTRPQHWFNINYGTSKAHISLTVNTKSKFIGCEIYIPNSKELYSKYYSKRNKITRDIKPLKLDWQDLPEKKAFRIQTVKSADVMKEENWNSYFHWLQNTAEKFSKVFKNHLSRE